MDKQMVHNNSDNFPSLNTDPILLAFSGNLYCSSVES